QHQQWVLVLVLRPAAATASRSLVVAEPVVGRETDASSSKAGRRAKRSARRGTGLRHGTRSSSSRRTVHRPRTTTLAQQWRPVSPARPPSTVTTSNCTLLRPMAGRALSIAGLVPLILC